MGVTGGRSPIFYEAGIVVLTDIIAVLPTPGIFLIQLCIKFISMLKKIYLHEFSQQTNLFHGRDYLLVLQF